MKKIMILFLFSLLFVDGDLYFQQAGEPLADIAPSPEELPIDDLIKSVGEGEEGPEVEGEEEEEGEEAGEGEEGPEVEGVEEPVGPVVEEPVEPVVEEPVETVVEEPVEPVVEEPEEPVVEEKPAEPVVEKKPAEMEENPFAELEKLRRVEGFSAKLKTFKSTIVSTIQKGVEKSLTNKTYGELHGPIAGMNKISISLYSYIDLLFWRFVNKVLYRKFEPDPGFLYDDAALPMFDALELGSAILVRGLSDMSKASESFQKTSEGGAAYNETVGEVAAEEKVQRSQVDDTWRAYSSNPSGSSLSAYEQARDSYAQVMGRFSLNTNLFNKELLAYKFERVEGYPPESVIDFFNREGWRLSNRVGRFDQVKSVFVEVMGPFIKVTGMSSTEMMDLFSREPEEGLKRLMHVPATYSAGFGKKLKGYAKKVEGKFSKTVLGASEDGKKGVEEVGEGEEEGVLGGRKGIQSDIRR